MNCKEAEQKTILYDESIFNSHFNNQHNKMLYEESESLIEDIFRKFGLNYQRDIKTIKNNKSYSDMDFVLSKHVLEDKYYLNWVADSKTARKEVIPRFVNFEHYQDNNSSKKFKQRRKKKKIRVCTLTSPYKPTKDFQRILKKSHVMLLWSKTIEEKEQQLEEYILTHIRPKLIMPRLITLPFQHLTRIRILSNVLSHLMNLTCITRIFKDSSVSPQFLTVFRRFQFNFSRKFKDFSENIIDVLSVGCYLTFLHLIFREVIFC